MCLAILRSLPRSRSCHDCLFPSIAMHVEDYEFAVTILHQSGFKLMYQDDLSR